MKITAISDLHGHYPVLEGGDLLIIAGDLGADKLEDDPKFFEWVQVQPYKRRIFIAGNHDNWFTITDMQGKQLMGRHVERTHLTYLLDSGTEFEGLKIWGSPWTEVFPGMNPRCKAFTVESDEQLAEKWALIPDDIDILVTHCPPFGILDHVHRIHKDGKPKEFIGSQSLLETVLEVKPRIHIFGHVHGCSGYLEEDGTLFINASHVNEMYEPVNGPIEIEI